MIFECFNTSILVSVKTLQIRARQAIKMLSDLTFNIYDKSRLKVIEGQVMDIVRKNTDHESSPLFPLPKRSAKKKDRKRQRKMKSLNKGGVLLQSFLPLAKV